MIRSCPTGGSGTLRLDSCSWLISPRQLADRHGGGRSQAARSFIAGRTATGGSRVGAGRGDRLRRPRQAEAATMPDGVSRAAMRGSMGTRAAISTISARSWLTVGLRDRRRLGANPAREGARGRGQDPGIPTSTRSADPRRGRRCPDPVDSSAPSLQARGTARAVGLPTGAGLEPSIGPGRDRRKCPGDHPPFGTRPARPGPVSPLSRASSIGPMASQNAPRAVSRRR
jgi:hypothetical protein